MMRRRRRRDRRDRRDRRGRRQWRELDFKCIHFVVLVHAFDAFQLLHAVLRLSTPLFVIRPRSGLRIQETVLILPVKLPKVVICH